MIEIIAVVLVVATLARFARGRGVKPWLAISVAIAGYLGIILVAGALMRGPNARWIVLAGAWAWIGVVVAYVRFVVGSGRAKPERDWVCSSCMYPNGAHAVVCEGCQQPWAPAP